MQLRCNTCHHVCEMPETFLELSSVWWRAHGHFPGSATLICVCGAEHSFGPDHDPDPAHSRRLDIAFYRAHVAHL